MIFIKKYKLIVGLLAIPIFAYCIFGNVFTTLYTYKSAKKLIAEKYNFKLCIVSFFFDVKNKTYNYTLRDKNGLEANYIYNENTNEFYDEYYETFNFTVGMKLRGSIIEKLNANKINYNDIDIDFAKSYGVINEDFTGKIKSLYVEISTKNIFEFTQNIKLTADCLKDFNISRIIINSENYRYEIIEGTISKSDADIIAKIRRNG